MSQVTVVRNVPVPPETAYDRWLAAYEHLHELYPERIQSMKVVSWEGNERTVACVENWAGRPFRYTMRERLHPPRRVEQLIVDGRGKGSTSVWSFEAAPGGSRVTAQTTLKGAEGFFLGVLFRKTFVREMDEGLARYAKFIEESSPGAPPGA